MSHLLPAEPIADLDSYVDGGGGQAIESAHTFGSDWVVGQVRASGLRGRGGAGFPTGIKWGGLADDDATTKFVVCNAAEGEPGTYKDRLLLRRNPYQVLEGLAVAASATNASAIYLGIKAKFTTEVDRLESAAIEMQAAGLLGNVDLTVVHGPDDYLLGEEKALLEVIEGNDPLPRLFPPYAKGLFEQPGGPKQPAAVNNVETLANVPHILRHGPEWFRSMGTSESPGTVVCTIGGDVATDTVVEVDLGTPLAEVIERHAGGMANRPAKMVLNGVSNAPLTNQELSTPLSYEHMAAAGSGLGSAGFTVFDDSACAVKVAAAASAFLFRGSCGQCVPCKLGTGAITEAFLGLSMYATAADIEELAAWTMRVTDANRCGLGAGQQALAQGVLNRFPNDLAHHLEGGSCPSGRTTAITTIESWDGQSFTYTKAVPSDAPGA